MRAAATPWTGRASNNNQTNSERRTVFTARF
jgi:hypothetical protein